MAIEIFTRRELKYVITMEQYELLVERMGDRMRPDKYGMDGRYTISSLYFESPENVIYFETKNKLNFRQKLRLRVYDDTDRDGTAFFEVKQKQNKVVNKRRVVLPLYEAYRYLEEGSRLPLTDYATSNAQVLREIDYFQLLYNLQPEMIISYDRHAMHGLDDADLRVTFDYHLQCRDYDLHVEHGAYGRTFIDPNLVILEVKVNDSVPLWLTRLLQELQCEQRSASKYCTSLELLKGDEIPGVVKENILIGGEV